jgi:hypothetical protein
MQFPWRLVVPVRYNVCFAVRYYLATLQVWMFLGSMGNYICLSKRSLVKSHYILSSLHHDGFRSSSRSTNYSLSFSLFLIVK